MDQNPQSMNTNAQFHFLRTAFKIIASVSVFSFILSQYYSSLRLPLLVNSIDEFSSSFSVNQLFRSNKSERNFIFLLCNGILVFIIKNSGLIAKPQYSSLATNKPKLVEEKVNQKQLPEKEEEEEEEVSKNGDGKRVISIDDQEEEMKEVQSTSVLCRCHGCAVVPGVCGSPGFQRKGDDRNNHHEEDEEENEEVIANDLSEEEQDRMFDDFIKKMKQEIIRMN